MSKIIEYRYRTTIKFCDCDCSYTSHIGGSVSATSTINAGKKAFSQINKNEKLMRNRDLKNKITFYLWKPHTHQRIKFTGERIKVGKTSCRYINRVLKITKK